MASGDGSFTLVRHDNNLLYRFDTKGQLIHVVEPNGNALNLAYEETKLLSVTDPTGQKLITFTYDGDKIIAI